MNRCKTIKNVEYEIIEIMDLDDDNQIINKKHIKPIEISNDILAIIASDYCELREKIILTMAITGNKTNINHHNKDHPLFKVIWKSEENKKEKERVYKIMMMHGDEAICEYGTKHFSSVAKAKIGYICDLVSETVEVEWMESNSNDKHALIHWSKVSTNTKSRICKNKIKNKNTM